MRTIDADALLKKIEEDADFYLVGDDENSKAVGSTLLDVKEQINAMPTVEPQRMRGKWILHIDNLFPVESTMECNQCHEHQPVTIDDNFCPNCGADMREE